MTIVGEPDPTLPTPSGPGDFGGAFAAMFLVVLLVGIGGAVWRVTTARRIARRSGMDPGDAGRTAALTDDGLEATYPVANLRGNRPQGARAVARRLRELQQLRDQGLVTEAEYAERRTAILDSL